MFGKKKNNRVINFLFEMYKIAHEAISSAHMENIYTVDEYKRIHESYSNTMLSVARAVAGEEGVLQLSTLCEQFHDENVKRLNKECEEIEERTLRDAEKEANNMEEKYDGYVTTMTKSPVYSGRWKPATREPGRHAREGEMGSLGQERSIEYIYHITLIPPKGSSIDVLNERNKLINVLKNKGFEAGEVYADTLSVHSEKQAAEFEEMFEPIFASTGIKCWYEIKYKGKLMPVVRYEEED